MYVSDIDPRIFVFIDRQSKKEVAVVALIDEDEFARAQDLIPDLRAYADFEEWRDTRHGFRMGLAMAGVEAKSTRVAVAPFLAWCRLTTTPPSERALDAFAAAIRLFRSSPESIVLAVVSQEQYEARRRDVAALSEHRDYREWLRHRRKLRSEAVKSGRHVEELKILVEDFVAWSKCSELFFKSPSIDCYAHLALEHLATDFAD